MPQVPVMFSAASRMGNFTETKVLVPAASVSVSSNVWLLPDDKIDAAFQVRDDDGGGVLLDSQRKFLQLHFIAAALGDVAPDGRDLLVPLKIERAGAHAHVTQCAVTMAVTVFEGVSASLMNERNVLTDLLRRVFGLNGGNTESGEFFMRVTQTFVRRGVELSKMARGGVHQDNRVHGLVDDAGEYLLALPKRLFCQFALGDVEPIADKLLRLACGIRRRPRFVMNPAVSAVTMTKPATTALAVPARLNPMINSYFRIGVTR